MFQALTWGWALPFCAQHKIKQRSNPGFWLDWLLAAVACRASSAWRVGGLAGSLCSVGTLTAQVSWDGRPLLIAKTVCVLTHERRWGVGAVLFLLSCRACAMLAGSARTSSRLGLAGILGTDRVLILPWQLSLSWQTCLSRGRRIPLCV